jgi:integrase
MAIEIVERKKRYRVVVRVNGKKLSKSFYRKIDAEAWEREILVSRSKGLEPVEKPKQISTMTLNDLRQRFEERHARLRQAPSTQITERSLYDKFVGPKIGNLALNYFTRTKLEEFLEDVLRRSSAAKANRVRTLLCGMFNKAVYWELMPSNPIASIKPLPTLEGDTSQAINFLTQEEVARLLAWLKVHDPWTYSQVRTLVNTGIRYGELLGLMPPDIRIGAEGGCLTIRRTYCRHTFQIRNRTKGGTARVIPLTKPMTEFLMSLAIGKEPTEPLFRDTWDLCKFPTKFRKHLITALKQAGVRRVRVHDLRHTFAVHFLERGGQLYDLQKILGHSTIQLTERYSHFSKAMTERSRGIVDHDSQRSSKPVLTVVDGGIR